MCFVIFVFSRMHDTYVCVSVTDYVMDNFNSVV